MTALSLRLTDAAPGASEERKETRVTPRTPRRVPSVRAGAGRAVFISLALHAVAIAGLANVKTAIDAFRTERATTPDARINFVAADDRSSADVLPEPVVSRDVPKPLVQSEPLPASPNDAPLVADETLFELPAGPVGDQGLDASEGDGALASSMSVLDATHGRARGGAVRIPGIRGAHGHGGGGEGLRGSGVPAAAAPVAAILPVPQSEATEPPPVRDHRPPRPIAMPKPPYPEEARASHVEGSVVLEIDIAADGTVSAARVLRSSGSQALDDAAVAGVTLWRFEPATDDGTPVAVTARLPAIRFRIDR